VTAFERRGSEPQLLKKFGPDLGIVLRNWRTSIDFQAGHRNLHGYATLAVSHHFGWDDRRPHLTSR
jgi:hypothetical protein